MLGRMPASDASPRLSGATSRDIPILHRIVIRSVLAVGFLSGFDLLISLGPVQVTHLAMALLLVVALFAGGELRVGGYVGFFYVTASVSVLLVLVTGWHYGNLGDRLFSTLIKVLLVTVIVAAYHVAFSLALRSVSVFFAEYLRVAHVFALLGVLQQAIFIFAGMDIFAFHLTGAKDYGTYLGVSALSVEPAFFACALLPAAGWHASRIVTDFKISVNGITTICAVIFSTSAVGYIGILFSLLITVLLDSSSRNIRVALVSMPLAVVAGWVMLQAEFIQLRLTDSIRLLQTGVGSTFGTNLSSYALAVNGDIAFRAISDTTGAGAGLGMYGTVYDHYIQDYGTIGGRAIPGRGSATSLLFRAIGELGAVGLGVVVWLGKCFILAARRSADRRIAIACAASFAAILIRMGEYFDNGVLFVLLLGFLQSRQLVRSASGLGARL